MVSCPNLVKTVGALAILCAFNDDQHSNAGGLLLAMIATPKSIVCRAASAEQASAVSTQQTQRQLAESLAAELNHLAAKTKTRPTDSDVRPSTFVQKTPSRTRSTNNGTSTQQPTNEELPSFVHKHQPWTANREPKNRQLQIAKVI